MQLAIYADCLLFVALLNSTVTVKHVFLMPPFHLLHPVGGYLFKLKAVFSLYIMAINYNHKSLTLYMWDDSSHLEL